MNKLETVLPKYLYKLQQVNEEIHAMRGKVSKEDLLTIKRASVNIGRYIDDYIARNEL